MVGGDTSIAPAHIPPTSIYRYDENSKTRSLLQGQVLNDRRQLVVVPDQHHALQPGRLLRRVRLLFVLWWLCGGCGL